MLEREFLYKFIPGSLGVGGQKSDNKLIESLRIGAEDMLATPFEPEEKEELVSVKVED